MAYVEMLMRMRHGQKVRRNKNFAAVSAQTQRRGLARRVLAVPESPIFSAAG